MAKVRAPQDELAQLWRQGSEQLRAVLDDLALHLIFRAQRKRHSVKAKMQAVAQALGQANALSDVLGRRRVVLEARAAEAGKFAALPDIPEIATVPKVPFLEAISDILKRTPEIATTAEQVADVYAYRHGFALAKSTSAVLTQRIQRAFAAMLRAGTPIPKGSEAITILGDFTKSYADVVYGTNLNTAYSAGRWAQAQDPDVAKIMVAGRVSTSTDSDVRRGRKEDHGENHEAANGFIAATTDEVWDHISPPYGYRCRCSFRLVSRFELERMGRLRKGRVVASAFPRAFRPHPNFARSRPDRALYSRTSNFGARAFAIAWPASFTTEHA